MHALSQSGKEVPNSHGKRQAFQANQRYDCSLATACRFFARSATQQVLGSKEPNWLAVLDSQAEQVWFLLLQANDGGSMRIQKFITLISLAVVLADCGNSQTEPPPPPIPCAHNNGGCDPNATCAVDQNQHVTCTCKTNYVGDGRVCSPSSGGCAVNNGGCDPHATCAVDQNQHVTCTCNGNYVGDGRECSLSIGNDPCNQHNGGCDPNATCSREGDFQVGCVCHPGYVGDGLTCKPIDCSTNNGGCDVNANCTSMGCVCKSGYDGDGMTCKVTCDMHAFAVAASGGAYSCVCFGGYVGDGKTCSPDPLMCTPSSQPSGVIGACVYGEPSPRCYEYTGSAFRDPVTATALCVGGTYTAGGHCEKSSSTVGGCLAFCGEPQEQVFYWSESGVTTAWAQQQCAQLNGTWLGK
jgi:hypothetical protein